MPRALKFGFGVVELHLLQ